ncbi:MAG: hypothetical protein IJG47_06530 [Microbacterium sp.]|nr:hypothetical protein [Microbacterium sp.]
MTLFSTHLFPESIVRDAAILVDESGVAGSLEAWIKSDQKHRGGRATTLSTRTVLIAWVSVALERGPLHMTRVAEVLSSRLSPATAAILCVPWDFAEVSDHQMYDRVNRATKRILDVLDFKPLSTRQRRLTKAEWDAELEKRLANEDHNEVKRQRMFRFANDLLHAQYLSLPEVVRRDKVSLTIDATFLSAFGRGMGKEKRAAQRPEERVISEPDADWYIRTYESEDSRSAIRKSGFGWEYELAAIISNDPHQPRAVPHIVIGFNHHIPNVGSNDGAREIFEDVINRGLMIDYAVADQAYFPGARAEVLQNFLRGHGAKLVMKYAKSQADREAKGEGTIQAEAHGAILVEGHWYCPALPSVQRAAVVEYQNALSADRKNPKLSNAQRQARAVEHKARMQAQVKERERWEVRPKESADERGNYPMRCPASGPSRTLECPLKPGQKPLKAGKVALPVLHPPKAPGQICTNASSVKFNVNDGGKYEQHHRYKSPEWQLIHSYGRQVIESFNGSLKHADNELAASGTRRLRGEVGQAFLTLLGVLATNASRIEEWQAHNFDGTAAPDALSRHARTTRTVTVRPRASRKGMSASRKAQLGLGSR